MYPAGFSGSFNKFACTYSYIHNMFRSAQYVHAQRTRRHTHIYVIIIVHGLIRKTLLKDKISRSTVLGMGQVQNGRLYINHIAH